VIGQKKSGGETHLFRRRRWKGYVLGTPQVASGVLAAAIAAQARAAPAMMAAMIACWRTFLSLSALGRWLGLIPKGRAWQSPCNKGTTGRKEPAP
jgi:hypothetical protein